MDDHLAGDRIAAIRQRLRRERMRRRRRRSCAILAVITVIAIGVLFSPVGPFGSVLFPKGIDHAGADRQGDAQTGSGQDNSAALASSAGGGSSDKAAPTVAIVVDDTASSPANLDQWLKIDAPLTFSVLPFYPATQDVAERLSDAGFRIMLHIPTENDPPNSFSGKGQLATGMSKETVYSTLDADLAAVPFVSGINNHQGGRGCNDLSLMTYECQWAQDHGFFVVDSDSSTASKVSKACQALGMPRRLNQLFIDHQNDPDYIRKAMRQLADIARRHGTAIGICHFQRPNTPSVVGEMIQTLRSEGINFAFVQDVTN